MNLLQPTTDETTQPPNLRLNHQLPRTRNDEYIAPSKAKAISRLVVTLCSELRGVALPLVNAFAIPDHILRAPIGLGGVPGTTGPDIYREYVAAAGFDV